MMWEWREGSWQGYSKDIINATLSREGDSMDVETGRIKNSART